MTLLQVSVVQLDRLRHVAYLPSWALLAHTQQSNDAVPDLTA